MNINIIIGKLDAIAQESSNDHTTKALNEFIQGLETKSFKNSEMPQKFIYGFSSALKPTKVLNPEYVKWLEDQRELHKNQSSDWEGLAQDAMGSLHAARSATDSLPHYNRLYKTLRDEAKNV